MGFGDQILGWSVKAADAGTQVARQVARIGLGANIRRSPVRTGRFKGNWRVGVGAPDLTFNKDLKDKGGQYTLSRGLVKINRAKWGDRIYITNTTPYGPLLERGRSPQAPPGGIVAITLADMRAQFPATVANIRRVNGSA